MNAPASPAIQYYWEDLPVDTTIDLGSLTVDRDEVLEFAGKYDPQPFHLSDEAAAQSMFGRLAASGWHTCAMVMGLMARNFLLQVEQKAELLTEFPALGTPTTNGRRLLPIGRYPYSILYRVDEGVVRISAIAAHARRPRDWQTRQP